MHLPGASRLHPPQLVDASADCTRETAVCEECDLVQFVLINSTKRHICACCRARLPQNAWRSTATILPLTIGASILFALAMSQPILDIETLGAKSHESMIEAMLALAEADKAIVALVVTLTIIVFPIVELLALSYLAAVPWQSQATIFRTVALRMVIFASSWSMPEVLLLGVLVTFSKLSGVARVTPDWGFFTLIAFVVLMSAIHEAFSAQALWRNLASIS